MFKKYLFIFYISIFAFFSVIAPINVSAQSCDDTKCSNPEECNKKITECEKKLGETSNKKNTLLNELKRLDYEMNITTLKINQTVETIKNLKNDIANLTIEIDNLDMNLNKLTNLYIEQTIENYKLEKRSPKFSIFNNKNFNDFINQYKYLSTIQKKNQNTMINMETNLHRVNEQKQQKKDKQSEQEALEKKLSDQQINLDKQKESKNSLLAATKNDETKYQSLLNEALSQLRMFKNFSSSAGGSTCLSSSPGNGSDGNFYSQRDPRWCKQYMGYSRDTIGEVGCYISSISMAYKKLGTFTTPSLYAANPSNFSLRTAYAVQPAAPSGYSYKQTSYSTSTIDKELEAGRFVIVQVKMSNVAGMHFFVIISGSNGNYKIHDPWFGPDQNFKDHYSVSSVISLRLFTK